MLSARNEWSPSDECPSNSRVMDRLSIACWVWVMLASFGWIGYSGWISYRLHRFESVHDLVGPEPEEWPSISVIVPACNEADHLEEAMQSLLDLEYPNLEIILVEDRSTDETPVIADRLAAAHGQLEVLHVNSLPDGWLGKVHALHRGVERASGDWYLFTDADIQYEPSLLQTAVRAALHENVDHLSLVPHMRATGFWHEALVVTFISSYIASMPTSTESEEAEPVGIGAFNLVRRSTFERTEGFDWLRMEIADDSGLGLLINRHGGRSRFALARDGLAMDVYDSFSSFVAGMDKNAFPIMASFDWTRVIVGAIIVPGFVVGPILGFLWPAVGAWPFSVAAAASLATLAVAGGSALDRSPWPFLGAPVAQLALVYGLVHSAVDCTRRGGVDWRGTTYSLEELERLQRVEL